MSAIALGTAALGHAYGPPGGERRPPDRREAIHTIRSALDAGITLIDTAPAYGNAEELVGEAVRGRDCVVATKVAAGDERAVRASVEASLRRLGRERIDILHVHNADRDLLAGALPEILDELRSEGLGGLLGATVYDEDDALAVIEHEAFDTVQLPYSAIDRRAERKVLSAAAAAETAVFARSVLLKGVLSASAARLEGRFAPLGAAAGSFRQAVGAGWEELPGAALAFVLARPGVTSAVVGPRDGAELRALLDGAERFADADPGDPPDVAEHLLDPRTWSEEPVAT